MYSIYLFITRRAFSKRVCQGCLEQQPNQLAHFFLDGSGCLDSLENIHHSWFTDVCKSDQRDITRLFDELGVCDECRGLPSGQILKLKIMTMIEKAGSVEEDEALCESILSVKKT